MQSDKPRKRGKKRTSNAHPEPSRSGGRTVRTAISPGFGRAIYEAIVRQRHADGTAWDLRDFAERMQVSQNTVTRWLKLEKAPTETVVLASSAVLGVPPEALKYGVGDEIYLINLPRWMVDAVRATGKLTGGLSGAGSADDARVVAEAGDRARLGGAAQRPAG